MSTISSGVDSLDSLEQLDGIVNVYLPDFKVGVQMNSKRLLKAENYASSASESIKAMYEQVENLCFTEDGIGKRKVLLRHLVMPG